MKKSFFLFLVTVMFTVIFVQSGRAQTPNPGMPKLTSSVSDLIVDGNYTYLGGEFMSIGYTMNSACMQVTTTNSTPTNSYPTFTVGTYGIKTVVSDGSSGWYIGGDFTNIGGTDRNRLAHLNSDGTLDANWNPNVSSVSASVNKLLIVNGFLYVAGEFTQFGGITPRNRLARISLTSNPTGTVDNWNPGSSASVNDIVSDGTYIYAGMGNLSTIGGQSRKYLGRVNISDGLADVWTPITANGQQIYTLALNGSDLYAGGAFILINGTVRNYIAKFSTASGGTLDATWNPSISTTGGSNVRCMLVSNGSLYIGGYFATINSVSRYRLAKIALSDAAVDATWNPIVGTTVYNIGGTTNADIYSLVTDGTSIFVGGYFASIGGKARSFVAKLNNSDGAADVNWFPNPNTANSVNTGSNYGVSVVAISSDNKVFIGGHNMNQYKCLRSKLVRVDNVTGQIDYNWFPNPDKNPYKIYATADAIYAGGPFTSIGGQSRNYLAKLSKTDGSADVSFNASITGSSVSPMVVDNGTLYFGGSFTQVGGQVRTNVASVNALTGAFTAWNPNANFGVSDIAINGSYAYLCGNFNQLGGVAHYYLGRVDLTNGTRDGSFVPAPDGYTYAIEFDGSGNMYVGGGFSNISGNARGSLAKYNSSLTLDATWTPNLTPTPGWTHDITTIALSGSSVYVGGSWENGTIGGQSNIYKAAKLNNTNGNADASWNPKPNSQVSKIVTADYTLNNPMAGTDVYIAGSFTTLNSVACTGVAIFSNKPLPVSLSSFTSSVNVRDVKLNWVTSSEMNNSGFEIERAGIRQQAPGNWEKIGFVTGKGTTNTETNYSFEDKKLSTGKYKYRLKQVDNNGNFEYHNLSGEVEVGVPTKYELSQNYPNPFNPMTKIDFQLPMDGKVSLKIYDITGREIATLVNNEFKKADYYTVMFNGSNLSSGVYFYRIVADKYVMTKKMVLLK